MKPIVNTTEIISHIQTEADRTAYEYLKLKDEIESQRKFNLLNSYVDFNASFGMQYLIPLFISLDSIDFILKYRTEIKRRFSIEELMNFSDSLKLLKLFKLNPNGFDDFKKMYAKIKPIKN
jgi:hypothetical protein